MSDVKRLDKETVGYWISRQPPIYVRLRDNWWNEREQRLYTAELHGWTSEEGMVIDYPPKTVYQGDGWQHYNGQVK